MKKYISHLFNGKANYVGETSYLAIKEEATAGTAVIPNVFVPLISESIKTVVSHEADRRMRGVNWKATDIIRGNRSHEGEIKVYGDPDMLGHFLNMIMVKGSTTGTSDGYTHPFTVGNGSTYTFDIKRGNYVQRFVGVTIEEMKMEFEGGQLVLTIQVKAMGQFGIATLGVASSGSVTSITLDDGYDIAPNRGVVVGDVLNVGGTDVTVSSVNSNGIAVGFSSTSVTASAGALVYLKPQTVTQPTLQNPFYFGNILAGFGVDASASATAAGSVSTATPIYDCAIVIKNNLFAQNGSNRFDPVQIIPTTKEASIKLKRLFTDGTQRQYFQDRTKQSITFIMLGSFIKADMSTQEKLTLTFNNVKLLENENAINVGEMVMDEQSYEVLYDTADGVAMSASLINRTSTY